MPPAPFSSPRLGIVQRGRLAAGGRDILLIPGLASGPGVWNPLLPAFAGNRLHLVHVAGFAGRAPGPNARGPLLAPITAELARYVRSQGLRAPVLIGHSMGGTLAMMLALALPDRIGRLMVMDMLPDGSGMVGGTSAGLGFLASQLNGYLTGTRAGRQLLAEMVGQSAAGPGNDPEVIAHALSELAQTDLTARLRSLPMPMEILYALPADRELARDRAARFRAAYARLPHATLQGIGPSGHMLMDDQPTQCIGAIRQFLHQAAA